MKLFAVLLALCFSQSLFAQSSPQDIPQKNNQFPIGPDANLTPGELCQHPDSYRYPEHIPYCNRSVDGDEKHQAFIEYDQKLGYNTLKMNRQDFKIDHYIPLCMGGGNDLTNLWPQNKEVYAITDPLEPMLCQLMEAGKMKQADAVSIIKRGKGNLDQVAGIIQQLTQEYGSVLSQNQPLNQ